MSTAIPHYMHNLVQIVPQEEAHFAAIIKRGNRFYVAAIGVTQHTWIHLIPVCEHGILWTDEPIFVRKEHIIYPNREQVHGIEPSTYT